MWTRTGSVARPLAPLHPLAGIAVANESEERVSHPSADSHPSSGKRFAYRREWCSSLLISSHSHFLALALDLASVSLALLDFSIFYFLTFKPLAETFSQSTALFLRSSFSVLRCRRVL
jgi:hypothetical protein